MANEFTYFINIDIGGRQLRLDQSTAAGIKNGLDVNYHSDSFENAFSLGTLAQAKTALGDAVKQGFDVDITGDLDFDSKLSGTIFGTLVGKLEQAEVRITDFAISTKNKNFTIGIAIDLGDSFTLDTPKLGLKALGFKLIHTA